MAFLIIAAGKQAITAIFRGPTAWKGANRRGLKLQLFALKGLYWPLAPPSLWLRNRLWVLQICGCQVKATCHLPVFFLPDNKGRAHSFMVSNGSYLAPSSSFDSVLPTGEVRPAGSTQKKRFQYLMNNVLPAAGQCCRYKSYRLHSTSAWWLPKELNDARTVKNCVAGIIRCMRNGRQVRRQNSLAK